MSGFPERVRTFTAIALDEPIRRSVHRETDAMLEGLTSLSRVPVSNLHVTLKFVGEVHRDEVAELSRTVGEAAELLVPGQISIEGFGAFPDVSRPRVIWAGVSDPEGILTPVYERLNVSLTRFGAKKEKKRYVPHVTVARVRRSLGGSEVEQRFERSRNTRFGRQRVSCIVLYMSEMERGGPPAYTVLGRYTPED